MQCWWHCKVAQLPRKAVWQFLLKLDMQAPRTGPSRLPPGNLSQRNENYIRTRTRTEMFLAALFVNALSCKRPVRRPRMGRRLNTPAYAQRGTPHGDKRE